MSELVWYEFSSPTLHAPLTAIISQVANDSRDACQEIARQMCDGNFKGLPVEIWKKIFCLLCPGACTLHGDNITSEIVQYASKIKKTPVEAQDVMYWWDNYISSPALKQINPLSFVDNNLFDAMIKVNEQNFDHTCSTITLSVCENRVYLPGSGDLLLGIKKNPAITSINFDIGGCLFAKKQCDLVEFEVGGDAFWSASQIMPISFTKNLIMQITMILETASPVVYVTCLYGFFPHDFREKIMKESVSYKSIFYPDVTMIVKANKGPLIRNTYNNDE